jgi:hypothetical protein
MPRPEPGLDCLICAMFARQETAHFWCKAKSADAPTRRHHPPPAWSLRPCPLSLSLLDSPPHRCRVSSAQIRQARPDSSLGLNHSSGERPYSVVSVAPSSLSSGVQLWYRDKTKRGGVIIPPRHSHCDHVLRHRHHTSIASPTLVPRSIKLGTHKKVQARFQP